MMPVSHSNQMMAPSRGEDMTSRQQSHQSMHDVSRQSSVSLHPPDSLEEDGSEQGMSL